MKDKKNIIIIILSVVILLLVVSIFILFIPKKNNNIINNIENENISTTTEQISDNKIILPANILNDVTMITTRLDISCTSNGVPLELEKTSESINKAGNYLITYNLKTNNQINKNKLIFFVYNKNEKLQSVNITFSDSTNDIYQLIKMIQYLLQVQELHIPVDEANQIYTIFNDTQMKSIWKETINSRTYSWSDSRNFETAPDMQIFDITYNY